jgi:hypothetical protein
VEGLEKGAELARECAIGRRRFSEPPQKLIWCRAKPKKRQNVAFSDHPHIHAACYVFARADSR